VEIMEILKNGETGEQHKKLMITASSASPIALVLEHQLAEILLIISILTYIIKTPEVVTVVLEILIVQIT
jgi:hypothetical protein